MADLLLPGDVVRQRWKIVSLNRCFLFHISNSMSEGTKFDISAKCVVSLRQIKGFFLVEFSTVFVALLYIPSLKLVNSISPIAAKRKKEIGLSFLTLNACENIVKVIV